MVRQEKGCWLRFMKIPPPVGDDAAAKGGKAPPPKGGKGAPTDELKPCVGRAWVSFEELHTPGAKETK